MNELSGQVGRLSVPLILDQDGVELIGSGLLGALLELESDGFGVFQAQQMP